MLNSFISPISQKKTHAETACECSYGVGFFAYAKPDWLAIKFCYLLFIECHR